MQSFRAALLLAMWGAPVMTAAQRPAPFAAMTGSARWVHSRAVGDSFAVQVAVPVQYAVDSAQRFGVLYVLDGDKSFGMARDIVDWLSWRGAREIVPLIVVAIGYGSTDADWWQKRSRDLTPSQDRSRIWGDWPIAGAAEAFQAFLAEELVPAIDREYRTFASPRIVAGVSFGGLFATWSLLQERSPFTAAIAVNPAFVWDDTRIRRQIDDRDRLVASGERHLYTAVGDQDDEATIQRPWREVTTALRGLGGLRLDTETLRGETHISSWPVGLAHGLKRVAAPRPRGATGGAR
jgi:hypothetical protein